MCSKTKCIPKGVIMSVLLVLTALATSALSFTTNCTQVVSFSVNSTQTINDIGTANRAVSICLVLFSGMSAIFERHINKKLAIREFQVEELKTENQELKSQLSQSNSQTDRNEPIDEQHQDNTSETNTGRVTEYPSAIVVRY